MTTFRRDMFGTVPLHVARPGQSMLSPNQLVLGLTMRELHESTRAPYSEIELVPAGHEVDLESGSISQWYELTVDPVSDDRETAASVIRDQLDQGVAGLAEASGADAVLLSGGIDSAAVAASLRMTGRRPTAYTAVYDPRSPDLKSARQVADHLELELVQVEIPSPTTMDLRRVIETIELPYKAQVEIGWPCLVLAETMKADGVRTAWSGEGSDELWGSHAFSYQERARDPELSFTEYRRRDFAKQASRNFLREWKVYAAHGIEVVMPFTLEPIVRYILGLEEDVCRDSTWHAKRPLQLAYADTLEGLWVLTRQKLGFQDGLGIKQDIANTVGLPQTKMRTWYLERYKEAFPGAPHVL